MLRHALRHGGHSWWLLALFFLACSSSPTGGGSAPAPGGAIGSPCDPAIYSGGCFAPAGQAPATLVCAASGVWQQVQLCALGQYCTVVADPAVPGKQVAQCAGGASAADAASDGGVTDAGSQAADGQGAGLDTLAGPSDVAGKDGGGQDAGGADVPQADSHAGAVCGDEICQPSESPQTCATDCGPGGDVCADGQCAGAETTTSCPVDCNPKAKAMWSCLFAQCGQQTIACGKDPSCLNAVTNGMNCLNACGFGTSCATQPACVAAFGANPAAKALATCGLTTCIGGTTGPSCGDGKCESPESASSCPADCASKPVCGDGKCDSPESASSCAADCAPKPVCGDGKCDNPESASTCPSDCGAAVQCGNESCDGGESAQSCPIDCGQGAKTTWNCLQAKCGSEKATCQGDASCLKALNDVGVCICACGTDTKCQENCVLKYLSNSNFIKLGSCGLNNCESSGGC